MYADDLLADAPVHPCAVFVMYLVTLVKNQAAGIGAAFIFHLYGFLLSVDGLAQVFGLSPQVTYRASIWCGWLSPLKHATFPSHDFGYDRLPTLGETFGIFYRGNPDHGAAGAVADEILFFLFFGKYRGRLRKYPAGKDAGPRSLGVSDDEGLCTYRKCK